MKKNITPPEFIRQTIRIPLDLWKKLNYLRIEGKIKSIQAAAVAGMKKIVGENDDA